MDGVEGKSSRPFCILDPSSHRFGCYPVFKSGSANQLFLTCQKSVDHSQCGAEIIELVSAVEREEGLKWGRETRERGLCRLRWR